jgi:DNA-binding SARP family transcriptional activator/tetratricopeptide (TPR) repeat protein
MAFDDRIRLPALNLIHRRSRLLDLLNEFIEADKRLITVYAPGGYGKSILLADFAQTTDLPVCWCSLEPVDRDPTSFLTLLAHSITDRFLDIEPNGLFKLIARGDTQASIHHIAESLAHVGPHIIIIDDYHKAVSAGMTLALNRLLEQLPATSTMVIAARGDMDLETGQIIDLLISERAAGLSEEELRFTGPELQRVMLKRFGRRIDLDTANEIAQATDGNIAQILLTGHITHTERIIGNLRQRLGDDRDVIYSYLAEEVFGKQEPGIQRFLLYTSVLPDMTAELCNELLEISDARSYIETLMHEELFITRIGMGFRYHDLFAEFLRGKLAEDEVAYRRASIRAAELLAGRQRYEEAVNLYLSVQSWTEAARLLEAQGTFFYDTGRALTLNNWLAEISEQELDQHPRLLLLKGKILNDDLGDPKQAMKFYQQAETTFRKHNDLVGAAETQVFRSAALRMTGQAKEALILAKTAFDDLTALKADDRLIAWAIRNRGIAYWIAGNLEQSLGDLRRALELFETVGDTYWTGMCHHEIGVCQKQQGNMSGAEHHYKQALRIWEALGNANDLANTLNSLGVCAYLRGDLNQALVRFKESLNIALQIGAVRRAAFAQAGIGDTYLADHRYEQALDAYELSTEFAQGAEVRSLEVYNTIKRGQCFFEKQDLAEALKLSNRAREIASETGLSYEKGLACVLQAKIYLRQGEYSISSDLFAEALTALAGNDILDETETRLWWGYSLLLDLRSSTALAQLQEAIRSTLTMGELLPRLGPTVRETQPLLLHFLYQTGTSAEMRDNIQLLLAQSPQRIEISRPSLQVFAFGPPTLVVAGERRQFSQRGKSRRLPEFLLYLILEGEGRGCRWSEVSAAIWPEVSPEKASTNFHQNVKRLRDVIFEVPDYIVVQDDYYQVNPLYFEWCDALAFDRLYVRASRFTPEEALSLQLEIIALYQGEFLAGFELEEWGSIYRARYEERFLQIVKLAAEQLLKHNESRQALIFINKGLAQDYFREELHRSAFKAYAQLGLYDQLKAHYAELCAAFEREFGVSPEPETGLLVKQLLSKKGG